ncbi:MAG TPA: alanyl-tRNA editing protein [Anaerolineales bacterium]|nr:alanyl-tRNA editing protein [Anaerolineales bacterium]
MTHLLYQTDSYLSEFEATITGSDPETGGIVLDRTAFYPGGGGQAADSGSLAVSGHTWTVAGFKRTGASLVHLLGGEAADLPAVGEAVIGKLDWERRYRLMRTHTAMHILCGVVFRDYGASVTGGNMEPLEGRMDFEFETMRAELVGEIEHAIHAEVNAGREVRVRILPREEAFRIPDLIRTKINLLPEGIQEVRTVEIVGLDLQADGGTHVRNTAEVGPLKVSDYKSKGKINKRIYVSLEH